jgi:amino acid transporter
VLGVRFSTRAQLVLALVSVAIVFAWAVYVVLKGGSSGFSLRPFNPSEASFKGITFGIVYAGLIFVGFESAANLAEETAEPRRNIPRAIFYSVIAATVFYVVLAWALLLASASTSPRC